MINENMFQSVTATKKTTSDFVRLMEAMRAHYKLQRGVAFALPNEIRVKAQQEELPEEAKEATLSFQGNITEFDADQQEVFDTNSKKYVEDKDFDEFKKKMTAERRRAKEKAADQIDSYFDKMVDIGLKYPASQNAIVQTTGLAVDFFDGLLKQIQTFVLELVDNIVKWLEAAFQKIETFFTEAAQSIVSFFGGIFGFSLQERTVESLSLL